MTRAKCAHIHADEVKEFKQSNQGRREVPSILTLPIAFPATAPFIRFKPRMTREQLIKNRLVTRATVSN